MFNPAIHCLLTIGISKLNITLPQLCETTLNTERSTHHTLILEASEIETLLPFVVIPILAGHCQLMYKCEVLHGDVFQRGCTLALQSLTQQHHTRREDSLRSIRKHVSCIAHDFVSGTINNSPSITLKCDCCILSACHVRDNFRNKSLGH